MSARKRRRQEAAGGASVSGQSPATPEPGAPGAPGAKSSAPQGRLPSPGARAHQPRRAALRAKWQEARHRERASPGALARPPPGDPASLPRPLEVCKLSPGVPPPPHHWEAGDTGGRLLARRLRCCRGRLTTLLEGSSLCQVSGGKHTPPIHNCPPCQGNSRALPHTHARTLGRTRRGLQRASLQSHGAAATETRSGTDTARGGHRTQQNSTAY